MNDQNHNLFNPEVYWENRLAHQCNLQGVGAQGLGEAYNKWLYRIRRIIFRREVNALSLDYNSLQVLDVGSGTGFYINEWLDLGVEEIVGLDLTQTAVDNLTTRFPEIAFFKTNICAPEPSLLAHRFDVITAFDVLFHIIDKQDYDHALINIFSLLKPGGYFIFSENFTHGNLSSSDHVVYRNFDFIVSILNKNGFILLRRAPIFYLMNSPIDTESEVHKLFWRILRRLISLSNFAGNLLGALIFPMEIFLTRIVKEGPSSEMMICRKPTE